MTRLAIRAVLILMGVLVGPAAAFADASFLVGLSSTSTPRPTIGVAFGRWSRPVGFEVEYASTLPAAGGTRPSTGSIVANVLVRTPFRLRGGRFYGVGGVGLFGASTGGRGSGEVQAVDAGVGVIYPLERAAALRVEYRLFVGKAPDASPGFPRAVHESRISVAISARF